MPNPPRVAVRVAPLIALVTAVAWTVAPAQPPVRAQEIGVAPAAPTIARTRLTPERVASAIAASTAGLDYLPGEVLVRFRDGVTIGGAQRALNTIPSQPPVAGLRWSGSVAVLRDAAVPDAHALAAQLRLQPEVAWAEPNYLRRPQRLQPDDPGYAARQWNLRAVDMPRAWDINPGGDANVIVAVVDSGVTAEDVLLATRTFNGVSIQDILVPIGVSPELPLSRIVSPVDLVSLEGLVVDFEGHGTHVAATIGEETNNGAGQAGIAYNVRIMPVKVCFGFWDIQFALAELGQAMTPPVDAGGCPDDAIAEGIRYAADQGAKIINVSLGGAGSSETMREALIYAVSRGAFVAIAAGNSFEEGNPIEYPAAYGAEIDGVMTVGATGPNSTRAFYSGTASGTEIAAPGGDFRQGPLGTSVIWQTSLLSTDSTPGLIRFPRFDRYDDTPSQGTSMASPHVAGLAALLVSQGVTSPAAIEALIKATALDLGAAGRDDDFGFGLIQPRVALRGFGVFTR